MQLRRRTYSPVTKGAVDPSRVAKPSLWNRLHGRLATPADDLAWIVVAGGGGLLTAAFIWLAPPLSHLYPSPIHDEFALWRTAITPEPLEETRAILALGMPLLLAAAMLAFGSPKASQARLDALVIPLQIAGFALLVVAVLGQPQTGPFLSADYFSRYLLSVPNLIAGAIIGLLLTAVAIRPPSPGWIASRRRNFARVGGWRWLAVAVAVVATTIWLLPAVITTDTLPRAGGLTSSHIPVQGEDYFAAVNGRTPLVDYIAQYSNLLPFALEPVLKAVGPSITSLSISMCVLSALAMVAIYGAFAQVTRSAWAALALYVPWVALSLFPWHDVGPYREYDATYYGVLPGRYLGPFALALLCALALRGRRLPIFALFLFAGLVLLNNYEFGVGALFALIVALGAGRDRAIPLRNRLPALLLQGLAGMIAAAALVSVITLARTGKLPDPGLLTYFNRLFLRDSFGLQPMSSLGLHWALYATYAAALLIAAVRYVRSEPDRVLTGMLAFSAVFGLASGMYFVGRSSQFQLMLLFPAWGFSLGLVAWTAAHALVAASRKGAPRRRLLVPGCAALIGFGVMVASIDRLPQPQRQVDRLREGGTPQNLKPAESLIEAWTHPGEHILLIGVSPDHLVADRTGVVNVSPINGVTALISPAEADRSIDALHQADGHVVIERVSEAPTSSHPLGIPEFGTILQEHGYRLVAQDRPLNIRVWRQ